MIEDVVARHVVGREPFHVEATWRDVYASGYAMRPDPTLVGVLSGIEMAMWDLAGKAVGKPAYELLGARVRERLRSYTYIYAEAGDATDVFTDPELAAQRAGEYAALGLTALKFGWASRVRGMSRCSSSWLTRRGRPGIFCGGSRSASRRGLVSWRGSWMTPASARTGVARRGQAAVLGHAREDR